MFVIVSLLLSVKKAVVRRLSSHAKRGLQFRGPRNNVRCKVKQFFRAWQTLS